MFFSFLARRDIFYPLLVAVRQSETSAWRARWAWLILGLTALLTVAGLPLWPAYFDWTVTHYDLPYSVGISMFFGALSFLSTMLLAFLGTLIVFAQPENRIGWLLSGTGLMFALSEQCAMYAVYTHIIAPDRELPFRDLALWIQHWLYIPATALISIALPLMFPNGRLPSKQWKWVAVWAIGVTSLASFLVAFHPDLPIGNMFFDSEYHLTNPYRIAILPKPLGVLAYPLTMLMHITIPAACLSLAMRFRQSDPTTRKQIKWFVFPLSILTVIYALAVGYYFAFGFDFHFVGLIDSILGASTIVLPILLGISIFKYDLFDVNIIISRTLVYGLLTVLIAGLYVFIVGLMGSVFQTSNNLYASLIATGLVAISFHSLRERLQRAVNRLMFGQRDEPMSMLTRLGQKLETAQTPDSMLPGMVEMVGQALKLPYVAIELFTYKGAEIAAAYGNRVTGLIRLPLVYQSEAIGDLVLAPRIPAAGFNARERKLLENIAHQTGIAIHLIRLTGDLQQSRERLITTREEERRRLRRDLHDGLGPALATLSLQAEAARDLIFDNPDKSMTLMNEVIAGTQSAIVNIRQVVYGLRPPALDDLGLVEALNEQAIRYSENGLAITIEAPSTLPVLPAAVEVAIYRIVQEALTNVVRHAKAATCRVQLCINGTVKLEICDDGQGIPSPRPAGVGLTSIRERAVELGGTCRIESTAGRGTRLIITLPDHIGEVNGDD